jgi:hypothetical protein
VLIREIKSLRNQKGTTQSNQVQGRAQIQQYLRNAVVSIFRGIDLTDFSNESILLLVVGHKAPQDLQSQHLESQWHRNDF